MSEGNAATITEFLQKDSPAFILIRYDKDLRLQIIDSYTNELLESALNWHLYALNNRKLNKVPLM
jgi:hypothetical protein